MKKQVVDSLNVKKANRKNDDEKSSVSRVSYTSVRGAAKEDILNKVEAKMMRKYGNDEATRNAISTLINQLSKKDKLSVNDLAGANLQ